MELVIGLGIILALVIANGLFVAAEFAIVGAPRAKIEHEAGLGSRLAQRVARILEDPKRQDRYIATTQVGISVASLGLGMYGEHMLADWIGLHLAPFDNRWVAAHAMASVIAVAVLTYLHIVIGEMVPKALALQRADRTVLYVTPVIEALQTVLLPVVVALNAVGNSLLRLIGVRRREVDERFHTSEELEFIVQESQAGGMLRGESGRILRELFEFGDLTAGEVAVPRVALVGIPVGTEADELRKIVRANLHTRYPVYSGNLDNIVGSVHIKELLRHFIAGRPVTALDARPLPHVPTTMLLDELLSAMRRQRAQMAVVMDEYGGTAGLVTIEDLFEEVVGEIEEGRARAPISRDLPGRLVVSGAVRLKDAGEAIGVDLEHPQVHSISGLVLTLLGRPAVPGDAVTWNHVRIDVTGERGRGVAEAVLTRHGGPSRPPHERTPRTGD
ncbi:MAG: HlyC/CorC family transporter [Acidobacteria bacterium]|nr:HlyC/CorC family transporter [Acidobacteriota bacterium]